MRLHYLLTICLLATLSISFHVQAQGVEPEFKNKVLLLKDESTLSDLDNSDLKSEMKNNMTGGYKINIVAQGKTSAIKLPAGGGNKYMVKIAEDTDPESAIELFKFDADKKNRIITVVQAKMSVQQDVTLPKLKLSFSKVKPGVYMITSKEPLSPGEYVFIVNRPAVDPLGGTLNAKGFAFQVGD